MKYSIAEVTFEYDGTTVKELTYSGSDLISYLTNLLKQSRVVVTNPFDKDSREVILPTEVTNICNAIFNAIKILKSRGEHERLTAVLATRLFEAIAPYWRSLLLEGRDSHAVKLWLEILKITNKWKADNNNAIHRGTLFFFLGESYLILGNNDLAYLYLSNAIKDDVVLGEKVPELNYPDKAPAFLTIMLRDDRDNQMYPIVERARKTIESFVSVHQTRMNNKFSMNDLDNRFLQNPDMRRIALFFILNIRYLEGILPLLNSNLLNTDIMHLRNLNLLFNLSLTIDETLKHVCVEQTGTGENNYISNSIIWFVCKNKHTRWMTEQELTTFWSEARLNVAKGLPNDVIPKLLEMKENYNGNSVRPEVFLLLLAYNLRNYGAHKIAEQKIISEKFKEILDNLFSSLFLVIQELGGQQI